MLKLYWIIGALFVAIGLLGVLALLRKSVEGFADEPPSKDSHQGLQMDVAKIVKSVGSIGKKLLDPDMWNYRIQIMNLSPVELARKQIALNSTPS
jgi:hypothetical protein